MTRVAVIGGGFFGMYIAEYCARLGCEVILFEREQDYMRRASYVNQARVHNGYHYPRSVLTALRSRISFPRFVEEFSECIDSSFEKYYLIGKVLGKVTAGQFEHFCRRIGAVCEPAPRRLTRLINSHFVEAAFAVVEHAFDAFKLRDVMRRRLAALPVQSHLGVEVQGVRSVGGGLELWGAPGGRGETEPLLRADHVFNCTYSGINRLVAASGLEIIPLRHEMTEMCLVEVPEELRHVGITVMCGPYFSVMPFPAAGLHSFSHVRYTPHWDWRDGPGASLVDAEGQYRRAPRRSAWRAMLLDAERYVPILRGCTYRSSIWEVKTILPLSDIDDSRPILLRPNHGLPGFHCLMGGKIDNVYDVVQALERMHLPC